MPLLEPDDDGQSAAEEHRPVLRIDKAPILVQEVFEAKGWREYDEEEVEANPTAANKVWHVMWKGGRFTPSQYEAANCMQRLNHYPKTMGITKKDCLLRNLRRMKATHGSIYAFFPESYILPTEYLTLVRVCEERRTENKPIWILKPTDSSQGRKIFIIRDLSEISYGHFSEAMAQAVAGAPREVTEGADPKLYEKGRAINPDLDMATTLRMLKSRLNKTVTPCVKFTEMHIVQRYLERPLCFCGYKLDLRIYVLLCSAQPLRIYWFNDCLVRFATQKYDLDDLENSYAHLTNTSINKNSTSYSTIKEGIRGGCKWSLLHFNREYPDNPLASPILWARIKAIVNLTLLSIAAGIPDNGGCFELFGYDVMIDENLRPWLLEVNCSPALGCDSNADREVKEPLIADLVDLLQFQKLQAEASLPAGGGARAAKARDRSKREPAVAGAAPEDSSAAKQRLQLRGKSSQSERVSALPPKFGGYELIYPFNATTTRLAGSVDGCESQIVNEIRTQLQKETSGDAKGAAAEEEDSSKDDARRQKQQPSLLRRPPPQPPPAAARPSSDRSDRHGAAPAASSSKRSGVRGADPEYAPNFPTTRAREAASRGDGGGLSNDTTTNGRALVKTAPGQSRARTSAPAPRLTSLGTSLGRATATSGFQRAFR